MNRRSFIISVGATVPTLPTPTLSEQKQEEQTLYHIQLHFSNVEDEVIIVPASSEHEAFVRAVEWAAEQERELGDGDSAVLATLHSEMDAETFELLRASGDLYAASQTIYRYIHGEEPYVLA